jgi:predicted metal-dependent HD superfamily phosphohydrolase
MYIKLFLFFKQPSLALYTRWIGGEYEWVPPEIYAIKRRAVLLRLLDREPIYSTPAVAQRLEQRARDNLAKAISSL